MRPGRVLTGLLLVAIGGLFLAQRVSGGAFDAGHQIARWWPVVLIAAGILQLLHSPGAVFGPLLVIALGALLLLDRLEVVADAGFGAWWSIVLILLGARLLYRGWGRRPARTRGIDGAVDAFVLFGERDLAAGPTFRGGRVGVLFGGATVDLSAAGAPPAGAALEITVAFGGVEVVVPAGWDVRVSGFPILGATIDSTGTAEAGAPRLDVRATAILGRVEVRRAPGAGQVPG